MRSQNRAAAAGTPQNRHAAFFTISAVYIVFNFANVTQHDKGFCRFPETQNRFASATFAFVQKGFIQRQIFGGRGQRKIEKLHSDD